jgi:PAS domain S-box-containing protein
MENVDEPREIFLRQRAEEQLKDKPLKDNSALSSAEMKRLIYELQVHQIELEMQNDQLTKANRESEAARDKFTELYDFAPTGYFTLSKEGEILEINLCASSMMGKERLYLKNCRFGFFISDETKAVFNDFLSRVFNNQSRQSCEVILSGTGSDLRFVYLVGIMAANQEQCLISAIDITEQRMAELELAKSRELYADLVANQSAGIYRINVQILEPGKPLIERASLEFVNDRFCELLEIDRSELEKDVLKFVVSKIYPEDLPGFMIMNEECQLSLKPFKGRIRLLIDDRIKWIRFETCPRMLDDGSVRWTGVLLDITNHKLAEEAIIQSEERYRMLLELATDAFFQGDQNGDFIAVNGVAIEQTGYSREELLKMNMKDLFSAEVLSVLPLQLDKLKNGEIILSERDIYRKDGTVITVEMKSRMMPDTTIQSFFRDITERKRIEKALKRKLGELEIYYELAITRERKMIALKSEINLLLERLGEGPKY